MPAQYLLAYELPCIFLEPCATEEKAFNYELQRPITEELYELFKPFGYINKDLGNKRLGEVFVLNKAGKVVLILQGRLGSTKLKVSGFDETEFKNVIFNGCYPLNPIAAYLLLNISEKVAQNERTLFTFISNDEPHSMARFVSEHTLDKEWSIGADLIYEYFSALFKKDVVNEFIHNIWMSIVIRMLQAK